MVGPAGRDDDVSRPRQRRGARARRRDRRAGPRLRGRPEPARNGLAALADLPAVGEGRRAYLDAVLAQLAGREPDALEAYRRAYELSSRDGDVHTVAASR